MSDTGIRKLKNIKNLVITHNHNITKLNHLPFLEKLEMHGEIYGYSREYNFFQLGQYGINNFENMKKITIYDVSQHKYCDDYTHIHTHINISTTYKLFIQSYNDQSSTIIYDNKKLTKKQK
jgi:hypothetical protein